jgi:hypothetical protein
MIPEIPPERGYESSGAAKLIPRYEDITQDGRVHLPSLMPGLTSVWRAISSGERLRGMMSRGIVPILSRILMVGGEGPFSVHVPFEVEGTWRLAKEKGGARIFLDMWLDAWAPHGSTFSAPALDPRAPRQLVGRIYAEHVVTRPFAPAAERKVTKLDIPGVPEVPEDEHEHLEAPGLIAHAGMTLLREHRFAMMHTDSNQHVNSLVYPRLFEEAVMQHASADGAEKLLAREIELRYRKPFFTGETARLEGAIEEEAKGLLAVGAFTPPGASKPSATLRMRFR